MVGEVERLSHGKRGCKERLEVFVKERKVKGRRIKREGRVDIIEMKRLCVKY